MYGKSTYFWQGRQISVANLPILVLTPAPDNFQIAALEMFIPDGYWIPEIANMIESKNEFKRHLDGGSDSHTYGFAMATNTNPIKVCGHPDPWVKPR